MNKGGYYLINKNDANIYEKCVLAITQGKPILWYEDDITAYYIDTMSGGEVTSEIIDDEEVFTYGDVILTKGGKTITITYENVVTETGNIQQTTENFDALMENIVDSSGNKRFIEGDGIWNTTITGLNVSYCKWSLSGTHLMLVAAGTLANGTEIVQNNTLANYVLPDYILNKIYPVWAATAIEGKTIVARDDSWGNQSINTVLSKTATGLAVSLTSNVTMTADRGFRLQWDLLIDTEYSE